MNYVVGLFDGMELGYHFSYWRFSNDKKAGDASSRVSDSYNYYTDKYFSKVTNGQLVDGLDAFYSDFKNSLILTHNAAWIVVNQISGAPQAEIDALTENWRRNSAR